MAGESLGEPTLVEPRDSDEALIKEAIAVLVADAEDEYRTAEDRALHVLRSAIDQGLFRPGERLPQGRLAALLGSSRMPVRSALRQLEAEGFVTLEPHRGAVVRSISESEIRDLYEIRILVESYALKRVAERAREEDLQPLRALAHRIDSASTFAERVALMDDFYRRLYQTANTPRIVALVMQLRSEVNRYGSTSAHGTETHRELLDALGMEDPELAAAWLAAHLRKLVRSSLAERSGVEQTEPGPASGRDGAAPLG